MKKILFFTLTILLLPICVMASEFPDTDSSMVEVYDLTDKQILYEKNSNEQTEIASLTKIATVITAINLVDNLDEEVTITKEMLDTVSFDASVAGLRVNDRVTYRDLLYAAMLPSGADATAALAILISGSCEQFVDEMNKLANNIGLNNTNFVNVDGLDVDNHYSTAIDVRQLLEYALDNTTFKEVYTTKEYTMTNNKVVKSTLYKYGNNDNNNIEKILGSKTGYTGKALYCLSSLSNINNHDIIIITLKAPKTDYNYNHFSDTIKIIDFMTNTYHEEVLIDKNKVIKTLPVKLSEINKYKIRAKQEIKKYLPSDYDSLKFKVLYDGVEELSFKNKKNEKIGIINYYYDNQLLLTEDVILSKDIKISYSKLFNKYYLYLIIPIALAGLLLIIKKTKRG